VNLSKAKISVIACDIISVKCKMCIFRLHRMREMQTIVTVDRGVCLSVSLSVSLSVTWLNCVVRLMQSLPNHFGLLLNKLDS